MTSKPLTVVSGGLAVDAPYAAGKLRRTRPIVAHAFAFLRTHTGRTPKITLVVQVATAIGGGVLPSRGQGDDFGMSDLPRKPPSTLRRYS